MTLRRNIAPPLTPAEYGTEILCAGWNPAVGAASETALSGSRSAGEAVPEDAKAFLDLFYRSQQT